MGCRYSDGYEDVSEWLESQKKDKKRMERWDSMGVLGLICRLYSEREAEAEDELQIESSDFSDEEKKDEKKKCSCNKTSVKPSQVHQEVTEAILDKDENEDSETDLNFLLD